MRIARVRYHGKTSTAVVKGRSIDLVRGGPFGGLATAGERAALRDETAGARAAGQGRRQPGNGGHLTMP